MRCGRMRCRTQRLEGQRLGFIRAQWAGPYGIVLFLVGVDYLQRESHGCYARIDICWSLLLVKTISWGFQSRCGRNFASC
jgi:hypothetical protein